MTRIMSIAALTLALAACTAQSTPRYVVRLNLERIAAQTKARDPGFTMLGSSAARPVNPS